MKFTISSYTTSRNSVSMLYPIFESIKSTLQFSDEVIVFDSSDGNDGTQELLKKLSKEENRVRIVHEDIDWDSPNGGVNDGVTKAKARKLCKADYLVQMDLDEIFHEDDGNKIKPLIEEMDYLNQCPILALPVIEPWSSKGKIRMDVTPWKWRISRNLPDITHGIPVYLRKIENGLLYSNPGSDSCDYISNSTGLPIPFANFMTNNDEILRQRALINLKLVPVYEKWFNQSIEKFPSVFHFSWFSIERKIKQYKMFWESFWRKLYNLERNENVFFPGVNWNNVSDEMIKEKAKELKLSGGHIFHKPYVGEITPSIKINREYPKIIKEWLEKNKDD